MKFLIPLIVVAFLFGVRVAGGDKINAEPQTPRLSPLSVSPLHLVIHTGTKAVGTGTGFIFNRHDRTYLVTAKHMLSFKVPGSTNWVDGYEGGNHAPDRVSIQFWKKQLDGTLRLVAPLLNEDGSAKWLADNTNPLIDVALLELPNFDDKMANLDLSVYLNTEAWVYTGCPLFTIGFPGEARAYLPSNNAKSQTVETVSWFPTWKNGTVASEPDIGLPPQAFPGISTPPSSDDKRLPAFFIDSVNWKGMSGAPVLFANAYGGYIRDTDKHEYAISKPMSVIRLVGVQSAIFGNPGISVVFKASVIPQIIDQNTEQP